MQPEINVSLGQLFRVRFPDRSLPVVARIATIDSDGIEFKSETDNGSHKYSWREFATASGAGDAKRMPSNAWGEVKELGVVDPRALLDANDPGITLREQTKRRKAQDKLLRAKTLRYYLMAYDKDSTIGRGHASVRRFISELYPAAFALGMVWKPSPGSLLRAVDEFGSIGHRPLTAFYEKSGKHDKLKRWDEKVLRLAAVAIDHFWAQRPHGYNDAWYLFKKSVDDLSDELGEEVPYPCEETLRLWIDDAATFERWSTKYSETEALRRFGGRGRLEEALRPLHRVMFDHNLVDAWAVAYGDGDTPHIVEKPWLCVAIDVYSRMVLAAILSFEPPSLNSVMACLRQVVRPKEDLIARYGAHKGATDGWGKPDTVIVDNAWENVGTAFQTTCEAAGINVEWAPVQTPTYKAYVERLFGTLNTQTWHKIEGGVPLTPMERSELGLDPKAKAVHSRASLEDKMWNGIVTLYHVEPHSTIKMAPANKWRRGLKNGGRPIPDDISVLDKVIGGHRECTLSAEGVFLDGERFHDPEITTELLLNLKGGKRNQRKGVTSTRTVKVMVVFNPGDASFVHVVDPTRSDLIRLPNWNSESKGLSWAFLRRLRKFANANNLAFHSDKERAAARVAHAEKLREVVPGESFRDLRKRARDIEPLGTLVAGDRLAEEHFGDDNIPQDTAAYLMEHEPAPKKAARKGGKKASKQAAETRARNRAAKDINAATSSRADEAFEPTVDHDVIEDSESFLDQLESEDK
jgi:putative transposase